MKARRKTQEIKKTHDPPPEGGLNDQPARGLDSSNSRSTCQSRRRAGGRWLHRVRVFLRELLRRRAPPLVVLSVDAGELGAEQHHLRRVVHPQQQHHD